MGMSKRERQEATAEFFYFFDAIAIRRYARCLKRKEEAHRALVTTTPRQHNIDVHVQVESTSGCVH